MNNKYYVLSFCAVIISFACVSAQTCPERESGPITNGVHAELIRSDSGLLLGIRVSWSWLSSDPLECFQSPETELFSTITGLVIAIQRTLNSTSYNNSVEFNITDLDCNHVYLPRVRATLSGIQRLESGNKKIFFGGFWTQSPPAMLSRVCVRPPQHQGRVNISWDPLPCHLQNGTDISGYIINYTPVSTGVGINISSSHSGVNCSQEVGGPYSCVVAESLIPSNQAYSIQVAAQNSYGDGSFSDPINVSLPVSSVICTNSVDANDGVTSTTSVLIIDASSDAEDITTIPPDASEDGITSIPSDNSEDAWIVMGAVVAVIVIMAGIVITVLLIVIYVLWKKLGFSKAEKEQSLQYDKSEGIDMKECSAYGKVISPQPAAEQSHIYESTT